MMNDNKPVYAVVVTFNRIKTLINTIQALLVQTQEPEAIVIIDNASTDGTKTTLENEFKHVKSIIYHRLDSNTGGAGGFYAGAKIAVESGAKWVWMMDDDCIPDKECLETLMTGIRNQRDVYSPIVLSLEDKKTVLRGIRAKTMSGLHEGYSLPFNGFLVHRETILEIGYPEKRFFIYGDDTEYNLRAQSSGRKIIMNTDSIMYHPFKNQVGGMNVVKMFKSKIWIYYKLRNAILIYKEYGHYSPKQIILLLVALFFHVVTFRFDFVKLWFAGLIDGMKNNLYVRDL